jgi:hypothetical protein
LTPEEFEKEFAIIEKMIGYECPAPIKKEIWAKCKEKDAEYLRRCLTIYKFCWKEPKDMQERIIRHTNS